jgi:hypothetical protein
MHATGSSRGVLIIPFYRARKLRLKLLLQVRKEAGSCAASHECSQNTQRPGPRSSRWAEAMLSRQRPTFSQALPPPCPTPIRAAWSSTARLLKPEESVTDLGEY